jgi:hypothetical protein
MNEITIVFFESKDTSLVLDGHRVREYVSEPADFGVRIFDNCAKDYNNTFGTKEKVLEKAHEILTDDSALVEFIQSFEGFQDVGTLIYPSGVDVFGNYCTIHHGKVEWD